MNLAGKQTTETAYNSCVPSELANARRWMCCTSDKTPINPHPDYNTGVYFAGSSSDPQKWGTMAEAFSGVGKTAQYKNKEGKTVRAQITGVGFALGYDESLQKYWAGIDLDGPSHTGKAIPQAVINECKALNTYGEASRSGDGCHFIGLYGGPELRGSSFDGGAPIEIYTKGRYFIVTGKPFSDSVIAIADVSAALQALHEKYIAGPRRAAEVVAAAQRPATTERVTTASAGEQGEFLKANIDSILNSLDPDMSQTEWVKVGAGLHNSGFSLSVWDGWSKNGKKYAGYRDLERRWNGLGTGAMANITGGYLVSLAKKKGWRPENVTDSFKVNKSTAQQDFSGIAHNTIPDPAKNSVNGSGSADERPVFMNGLDALTAFLEKTGSPDFKPVPLGFNGLDAALKGGIMPGSLCAISAGSSSGKSTLAMQIVEGLTVKGYDALVFSFEMSRAQLISRSLSRLTFEKASAAAVTSDEAMFSNQWSNLKDIQQEALQTALKAYKEYAGRLYVEDNVTADIDTMIKLVEDHIAKTGRVPVILIDYLQLFNMPDRVSMAEGMREITRKLKRLAVKHDAIIILISAVNRSAQDAALDMTSSFGSSFVEYSADYMFTLDFVAALAADEGRISSSEYTAIRKIKKKSADRGMILTVQKSRQGMVGYNCGLSYYAAFNDFVEMTERQLQNAISEAVHDAMCLRESKGITKAARITKGAVNSEPRKKV